ncbi:hypothetical protein [Opitutus terrae]|uniref:hypothetical protein n=1 Tax=Opitutus terrae TaxID=107709 RepID=UPI0005D10DE7|nr:hypothetical protein [Opitutus terrae]
MSQLTLNLALGIVSGVLTAALLYFAAVFFRKVIIPWYLELVYRGVDLSGKWTNKIELPEGLTQTLIGNIRQSAHRLSGEITLSKNRNGEEPRLVHLVAQGEVRDRLVTLRITSKEPKRISLCVILLEVFGSGDKMRGFSAWYDTGPGEIAGTEVEWNREKA